MMSDLASALLIPDSLLAKEATDLLREHSTDLLFNHSIRVYLFAAEQGRKRKLRFDPELLYVAAAFHDSVSSRNSRALTNALRSMAQTLSVSFSLHIRFLMNGCKLHGKPLLCTPPPESLNTCAPR
jgi:hypothetical protein